ncbi:YncE family protein [Sphingomonas sp.]|uniref:YncE family protein n=1 Tax=Sphingomonas sp. TaxID=28214 RepID=UPI003CC6D966
MRRQLLLIVLAAFLPGAAPAPSHAVASSIPGPDGAGWDYARFDPATRRLYVAHGDAVTVIDLAHGGASSSIGAVSRAHAALPIPGTSTLLVTSGRDGTVRLLDTRDGHETARLTVGENPDAAIWDPATRRALVMNAESGSVSVVDVVGARVERTIPVKPALEYAAIGPGGALFVNDEDANEIEVIDLRTGTVGTPIALTGCEGPTGLAYDRRTARLISACANGKTAIVDARRRRLAALVDIGRGPDAVILDEARRLAFVPCGREGTLEVLALDGPGGVRRIETVRTAIGARTGALDPSDGAVYLPTADYGPPATAGGRPVAKPGTFRVLVVRPS